MDNGDDGTVYVDVECALSNRMVFNCLDIVICQEAALVGLECIETTSIPSGNKYNSQNGD